MASQVVQESMPKSVIGMQNRRGFTLIEILVVLLIVGITLGFAMLAFGDFGNKRRITSSAEHFVNYVKLVQQEATLESATLGISFNQTSYQVLRFKTGKGWQAMSAKGIFRSQNFPKDTLVRIETAIKGTKTPQIIINASGDMTPFKLHIGSNRQDTIIQVNGEHNGSITLKMVATP